MWTISFLPMENQWTNVEPKGLGIGWGFTDDPLWSTGQRGSRLEQGDVIDILVPLCCTNNLGHSNCPFMYLPPKSLVYLIYFPGQVWEVEEGTATVRVQKGKDHSLAVIWVFYVSQTHMLRPNHQCYGSKRWSFQEVIQSEEHSPHKQDEWP